MRLRPQELDVVEASPLEKLRSDLGTLIWMEVFLLTAGGLGARGNLGSR